MDAMAVAISIKYSVGQNPYITFYLCGGIFNDHFITGLLLVKEL